MTDTPSNPASLTPAYVPYSTFKSTLTGLVHNRELPPKLDNTVLSKLGGSTRAQFLSALRYLGLISKDARPTPLGHKLAAATGDEWKMVLGAILGERYGPQLNALKNGTPGTFKESFNIDGAIGTPAARFLLAAAKDIGLQISPHIQEISGPKRNRGGAPKDTNGAAKTDGAKGSAISTIEVKPQEFRDKLLDKFPAFDPEWDEARQKSWFTAYERLLSMTEIPKP